METFRIHEDQENMQPKKFHEDKKIEKNFQKVRVFGENRAPLQNLTERNKEITSKKEEIDKIATHRTHGDHKSLRLIRKPSPKIDSCIVPIDQIDKQYENDIWTYLRALEKSYEHAIKSNYMSKQPHINWNMRSVLIDWLVDVCDEYKMNNQTLHLGINYLDRFLSNISVVREKLQLVGATTMFIAGKVEEIYPPDVKEWTYLSGDSFTIRQVLKMEQLVIRILEFRVHTPTILDFLKRLCVKHEIDTKTMNLAMYLSELSLLEGREYLKHIPSKLASASLYLARHTLNRPEPWNRMLEDSTGYSLKALSPVVLNQQRTFKSSPYKDQKAIQIKYKSDKYGNVAMVKPRVLLFDENVDEE